MNKLLAIAVVAISVFSVNAQNLRIIPSNVGLAYQEINDRAFYAEEGITISNNGSRTLSGKENVMPTATITGSAPRIDTINFSVKTTEVELVPLISDAEIAKIDSAAEAYQQERLLRLASSKNPHCNIEALRSIYGNEKTVNEIAYGDMTNRQITENKLAIKAASKKQTGIILVATEGD